MGIVQYKNFAYIKGPKGDKGDKGLTGDRGVKGDQGPQGDRGPAGEPADNAIVRSMISGTAPIVYNNLTGEIGFDDSSFATKTYVDTAINNQTLYSTDDLAEGGTNLYYTDNRARNSLTAGAGIIYSTATGEISIGQSVGTTDNVIFGNINASGDVQIDGNLIVSGTTITINATELAIADNLIYLNEGSTITNPDLGFVGNYNDGIYHHAGFFRDASDGYWKVFDGYVPEPDASPSIDITHPSFNLANLQATEFKGSLTGNADTATRLETPRTISGVAFDGTSDISLTTTEIAEGANQYFTTTRARNVISATGSLSYNSTTGVISYTTPTYTTTEISEGTNQYFTTTRARTSVSAGAGISYNSTTGVISSTITQYTDAAAVAANSTAIATAKNEAIAVSEAYTTSQVVAEAAARDVAIAAAVAGHDNTDEITEGTTNLYYTDARARAAISATGSLSYNSSTGVISYTTPSTTGITEGTNLYYTDARARAAISQGTGISYNNTTGVVSVDTSVMATKSYVDAATSGVALSSTDDLAEGATNLYFTGTRARNVISATGSLSYDNSTGVISYTTPSTTGIAEGTNLYYTDARARAAISQGTGISYNNTTGVISVNAVPNSSLANSSITIGSTAITLGTSSATLSGLTDVSSATFTGALVGNANTTTALQTSRTINNIPFDGTANIIVEPYVERDDSSTTARMITFVDSSTGGHQRLNMDIGLQYFPSSNTLISSNFTGALSGNATTSSRWFTPRTITLGGDLSGSVSIDGSANVTLTATATGVVLGTGTVGNYVADVIAGTGISVSHTPGEGSAATIAVDSTIATKTYVDNSVAAKDNTDEITEGTSNLYYTNARARAAISATGSLSYNNSTGVISFTDAVTSVAGKTGAVSLVVADVSGAASTTYVDTAISNLVNSAPAALDTLNELASALGNDANFSTTVTNSLAGKASTTGSNASGTWGINITGAALIHTVTDSRSIVTTPQTINQGVVFDFKQNATEGLSDGGTYFGEMTFRQYGNSTDWTGGASHQFGFTDNGNIWQRHGTGTSWGSWKRLLDTTNVMSGLSTGALSVTGDITATGELTAYYSDANLKKDIVNISNPLNKLQSIRGVHYRPNETALSLGITDKAEVGVIAQEIEAVLPELVADSAFAGYKTVKYDRLTALLIEAVKELSEKVRILEEKLGE
jgi:hypothetical protein